MPNFTLLLVGNLCNVRSPMEPGMATYGRADRRIRERPISGRWTCLSCDDGPSQGCWRTVDAGVAGLIGLILKMRFGGYRYFKNPPIRRTKNPQLEPNPSILTPLEGQDAATGGFYGAIEAASRWVERERDSAADERGPRDGEEVPEPSAWEVCAQAEELEGGPVAAYLRDRWEQGVHSTSRLFLEMQKRGYEGCLT
jgi:hypothetical protein